MGLFSIFTTKKEFKKCGRPTCKKMVHGEEGKMAYCSEECKAVDARVNARELCRVCETPMGKQTAIKREGEWKVILTGPNFYLEGSRSKDGAVSSSYVQTCSEKCYRVPYPPPPPEMVPGTPEFQRREAAEALESARRKEEYEKNPEAYEAKLRKLIKQGRRTETMQNVSNVSTKLTEVNRLRSEARKYVEDVAYWKKMGNAAKEKEFSGLAQEAEQLAKDLEFEARVESEQMEMMNNYEALKAKEDAENAAKQESENQAQVG